jgi:hypothetical protein
MAKRKIFDLIDENILREVISNHSKRRKFVKDILNYDKYVEYYYKEYEDEFKSEDNIDEFKYEDEIDDEIDEFKYEDEIDDEIDNEIESEEEEVKKNKSKKENKKPRKLSKYNKFIQDMMPEIKIKYPLVDHQDRFRIIANMWNNEKSINRTREC